MADGSVDCYTQLQTPIDAMLYRVSCVCRVLVMSALYSTLHALQCVLAGDRRATTNKGAWQWATAQGPKTAWDLEGKVGGGWTYLDISGCHSRCGVALLQRAVRLSWHHVHVELGRLSARSHLAGTGGAWATMQMCLCPAMTQAQRSVGWLQLCKWQLELL